MGHSDSLTSYIEGGRVRGIPDVHHAGLDEYHVTFLQRLQVQANLIVPILKSATADELSMVPSDVQNVQLWGLLIAHECHSPRHWQPWEMELLQQLGDQIAIAIRDNGPGIPGDQMTCLFDPFLTTKPVGQGTGLGLSICYQIVVKAHQGFIRCVNLLDGGAEFQVELPILRR